MTRLRRHRLARAGTATLLVTALGFGVAQSGRVLGARVITPALASSSCQLNSPGGAIQHVIQIQFDNFHFTRDNPSVPSDLEQVPNLLNFMKNNGSLLTNHHTPLI